MNKSLMLQNMILAEIRVGRLKVGDPILSRNQLCKKYNCSRRVGAPMSTPPAGKVTKYGNCSSSPAPFRI